MWIPSARHPMRVRRSSRLTRLARELVAAVALLQAALAAREPLSRPPLTTGWRLLRRPCWPLWQRCEWLWRRQSIGPDELPERSVPTSLARDRKGLELPLVGTLAVVASRRHGKGARQRRSKQG